MCVCVCAGMCVRACVCVYACVVCVCVCARVRARERERAYVRAQLRLLCNGAAGTLGVLRPVNPCGYIKAGKGGGGGGGHYQSLSGTTNRWETLLTRGWFGEMPLKNSAVTVLENGASPIFQIPSLIKVRLNNSWESWPVGAGPAPCYLTTSTANSVLLTSRGDQVGTLASRYNLSSNNATSKGQECRDINLSSNNTQPAVTRRVEI